MEKIKAVIFDLDGTLVDTIPLYITCFCRSLESIGQRSLSDEDIVAAFGSNEEGSIYALHFVEQSVDIMPRLFFVIQ